METATIKEMLPPPTSTNWPPKLNMEKKPSIFDKPLELTVKNIHNQKNCNMETSNNNEPEMNNKIPMFHQPSIPETGQQDQIVLPPPPPLWYPPLYPPGSPYASTFDPLHFFIDLRVSGHIYDRKTNNKEPQEEIVPQNLNFFKQSRHSSAFSVPGNSAPINLTNSDVKVKFDVKSMMGLDKNGTSTNYIMQNIDGIYKNINKAANNEDVDVESEEEKKIKRDKDLRALIGLELVVDYMSNNKKGQPQQQEEDLTVVDAEEQESRCNSPAVEVVDTEHFVHN